MTGQKDASEHHQENLEFISLFLSDNSVNWSRFSAIFGPQTEEWKIQILFFTCLVTSNQNEPSSLFVSTIPPYQNPP